MTRKVFLLVLCMLLVAGVTLGAAKPKAVTISVGNWPKENETVNYQYYQELQKVMKEKYNVTVVPDDWQYAVTSFLPKAAAGKLPTLYNTWFTETQKIIDAGYAADISAALKKNGWDKAINPQLLPVLSKNGKIYGVPRDAYLMGLMMNVELFRRAGLVAGGVPLFPDTYEELAKVAQLIKEATGTAGFVLKTNNNCGGWHFMNIAWSYGAEFEKKVGGKWKAVFNSPEAVAALQYVKDLRWKYDALPDDLLIDWVKGQELIATGQGAMKFDVGSDTGGFSFVINNYKMDKDDIAMCSMPAGPKGRVALMGGNLVMFAPKATAAQIEAGLKWLELTGVTPVVNAQSRESFEKAYQNDKASGFVIGNKGIPIWINPERTKIEDELKAKYSNVNLDLFKDYMNFKQVTIRPEEPVNCQELYKALDNVIQAVLTDQNADPKALLDKAVAEFQKDYLDKL